MSIGFAPWTPSKETQPFLDEVIDVIYAGEGDWPLSQRYWLYRLMATKGWLKVDEYKKSKYPKAKQHLCTPGKNLNNILDRGRRSGVIPWAAVASKRGEKISPYTRDSAESMADSIEHLVSAVQFDRQAGQERAVVLWCETEGLVPLVKKVAGFYGAPVLAGKGFDVIGAKHDFAKDVAAAGQVLVLHMGDLDRSGHTLHVSLLADLTAFIDGLGGEMELKRIALTEEQVSEHGLGYAATPALPGLNAGNHGAGFTSSIECQLEAMDADDIRAMVAAEFEMALDMKLFNKRLDFEKTERVRVLDILRERLNDE